MEYTLEDELNFIAWIATNGQVDYQGKVKNKAEIENDGLPKKRFALQRIDYLRKYRDLWRKRELPVGWIKSNRKQVIDYIDEIAIPTIQSLRDLQLGDVV